MVSGPACMTDLPLEVLEHILVISDPIDVASTAQVCRLFRGLVYPASDEHFWRALYLAQSFDDPREAVTYLGKRRTDIKWREELQRIIRARTVVNDASNTVCRPDERCQVLRTLLDMVTNVPPIPFPECEPTSRNVLWMQTLLEDGAFLDLESHSHEEEQLRARLHTWFGLTARDALATKRILSRAYVYSQRNYLSSNSFGPFMRDGSGVVNWVHMQKLAHVFASALVEREVEREEDEELSFESCSLSLTFCQAVIPPSLNLNRETDWAGVEGLWRISYCFMDHRELLIYNDSNLPEDEPLDHSIFEEGELQETFCAVDIFFRVINVEPDPDHPARPKINYIGEMDGNFSIVGYVKLTPDDQIRWHFVAGNGDQPVWWGEAIVMGNIRSQYGVLGAWSTTMHDPQDPIGPFWMQCQHPIED